MFGSLNRAQQDRAEREMRRALNEINASGRSDAEKLADALPSQADKIIAKAATELARIARDERHLYEMLDKLRASAVLALKEGRT